MDDGGMENQEDMMEDQGNMGQMENMEQMEEGEEDMMGESQGM